MLTVVIRAIIIYLLVLFLYRLMGKRQLGEMQPFELVLTLIIADLATIPMAEISVPVLHGIVPLLTLVFLHFMLTLLCRVSMKFSKFLSGKPIIVIDSNGIDHKALKNLNITIDDVMEAIRGEGFFSLEQVEYAIMETNGKMSVMPKSDYAPATNGDLKIKVPEFSIPINIISEGKINEGNLRLSKLKKEEILDILKKVNIKRVKDCLVLSVDLSGNVYIQKYGQKYQTLKIDAIGEIKL